MANTLTGLYPTIYEALDEVSREQVGFIPAVLRSSSSERVAKGQKITWPVVPPGTPGDITPAATGPTPSDNVVGAPELTISKSRSVTFHMTGEELKGLKSGGTDQVIVKDAFTQAMRALANEIEVDLAATAKEGASRAFGTAGTAPFATASDLTDLASVMKILDDNGAPKSGRSLALNSAAVLNLRAKHAVALGQAGADGILRSGALEMIEGVTFRPSAGLTLHTKGTGTLYVTSGSTAVGVEAVALVTGTGTVLAGDVVTFAADSVNKYVVNSGVSAPGTIQLGEPGAREVIATANALTIGGSYTPNILFTRDALALAVRLPAAPDGGDSAEDVMTITDPVSGLVFEVRLYRQYRQVTYEVGIAWGQVAVKSENIAILLG